MPLKRNTVSIAIFSENGRGRVCYFGKVYVTMFTKKESRKGKKRESPEVQMVFV